MINGIIRQRRDAATQHVWIVKTSLQCPRENISACRAHSVTTAPSCELTANMMMNMTVPDLEKLIPTIMVQKKALEVIHELPAWIDVKEMEWIKWSAK